MIIKNICPHCGNNVSFMADELYWSKDNRTMCTCEHCSKSFVITLNFELELVEKEKRESNFYEWMYKVDNEKHWHLCSRLMTEEQAKRWLEVENIMKSKEHHIQYKKTGRVFKC